MNRVLASLGLALALSAPAQAFGQVEAIQATADPAFQALAGFRLKNPLRRFDAKNGAPGTLPSKAAPRSKLIRLRGFVNVSGTAYLPGGQNGTVFITVSGDTQLQDDSGHYLNGLVTVSDSSPYFVNGNYVNGWPRPLATVTLYNGGRYLGSVRIQGSIPVSGFNSGGWVRLSGSGWVEGSGWISDEAPQAP